MLYKLKYHEILLNGKFIEPSSIFSLQQYSIPGDEPVNHDQTTIYKKCSTSINDLQILNILTIYGHEQTTVVCLML